MENLDYDSDWASPARPEFSRGRRASSDYGARHGRRARRYYRRYSANYGRRD